MASAALSAVVICAGAKLSSFPSHLFDYCIS